MAIHINLGTKTSKYYLKHLLKIHGQLRMRSHLNSCRVAPPILGMQLASFWLYLVIHFARSSSILDVSNPPHQIPIPSQAQALFHL